MRESIPATIRLDRSLCCFGAAERVVHSSADGIWSRPRDGLQEAPLSRADGRRGWIPKRTTQRLSMHSGVVLLQRELAVGVPRETPVPKASAMRLMEQKSEMHANESRPIHPSQMKEMPVSGRHVAAA